MEVRTVLLTFKRAIVTMAPVNPVVVRSASASAAAASGALGACPQHEGDQYSGVSVYTIGEADDMLPSVSPRRPRQRLATLEGAGHWAFVFGIKLVRWGLWLWGFELGTKGFGEGLEFGVYGFEFDGA